jgi:hypothetical protein
MWFKDVCERCLQFVPAMLDQHAYQAALWEIVKLLCQGLGIRPNNPHPGPRRRKKAKTLQEAAEMREKENDKRDARNATRGQKAAIAHLKNQQEINEAKATNKALLDKRHAEAAAAVAAAGEGLQGQGRGPAPAAAGQSSQGKGPATASAGDGDLPPEDQALLAQLRKYCEDPKKREVCNRARFILLGSRKRHRGKQRAKPRESSGDESSAETTDDDCGQGSSANILPVGSTRRKKAPPQKLTMLNLVMSLNALGSVLNKLNKQKSEAKGTNSKAQQRKIQWERRPFRITFKNTDGREFDKLDLVSDQALWGHILPQHVHSVNCFHAEITDLNMDFDVQNYRTTVAELPEDHHVVKVLQKNNIEIPNKEQTATLPLSATTRSDP